MDNLKRTHRKIDRIRELSEMENPEDAYWWIVSNYRYNANDFVTRLKIWTNWAETRYLDKTGHKETVWTLLSIMKGLLNDAEAMQDDAEASYDFIE